MHQDWNLKLLDAARAKDLQPARLFDLSGKVAIVTSAGGGLGAWLSAGLAAAGAQVLLTDMPRTPTADTANAIREAGGTVGEYPCDLLEGRSRARHKRGVGAVRAR